MVTSFCRQPFYCIFNSKGAGNWYTFQDFCTGYLLMNKLFILYVFIPCFSFLWGGQQVAFADSLAKDSIDEYASIRSEFETQISTASDSLEKLNAFFRYGTFLDEQKAFEKSVNQLNNALRVARAIANYDAATKVLNHLGGMYWSSGDCEKSTNYFEQALASAELSENKDLIAMVKMNLSGNYNSSGNANKAIEYSLAALEIKENSNSLEGICFDYVTVGEIFQNIGNVDKWKLYIKKAYDLKDHETCAKMTDLVMIYNNLGTIAEAEKEYTQALAYYDTMMIVSKSNDYYEGMGISLLNSALIYKLLEKPEKALELTTESMQYLGDVAYFIMAVDNVKAQLLQELGRSAEALALAMHTLANDDLEYYPNIKQTCLTLLYTLNYELGNYSEAFSWNDSLRVYETKLRDEENLKTVEELETKYQTEKKEQHIELLQAENQVKHQAEMALIATSVALLLFVVVVLLLNVKKKRQNEYHQLVLRQQLLRSQMNPHFLFNALGSIQNFMYKNDTKKAAGYLGNFASLTRSILEHSVKETVSLFDEIEMLRNYIELEKMRLNGRFDYVILVAENIETEFINVPPMLLQPFVENAIKHGFKKMESGSFLRLNFTEVEDVICVVIHDNGIGINNASKNNSSSHRSMSMQIFDERRKVLAKRGKRNVECEISDLWSEDPAAHGTKVEVRIPFQ